MSDEQTTPQEATPVDAISGAETVVLPRESAPTEEVKPAVVEEPKAEEVKPAVVEEPKAEEVKPAVVEDAAPVEEPKAEEALTRHSKRSAS